MQRRRTTAATTVRRRRKALVNKSKPRDPRKSGCDCDACPLKGRPSIFSTPRRKGNGLTPAILAIVGEAPARNDERKNAVFAGMSGYEIDKACNEYRVPQERVHLNNALLCRPTKKLEPDQYRTAIACCKPRLLRELRRAKPKLVLTLGSQAMGALVDKWKIKDWAGAPLMAADLNIPVLPTWHPAFAMRKPFMWATFYRHFERAWLLATDKLKPFKWPKIVIEPGPEMIAVLAKMLTHSKLVGMDVETAGASPTAPLTAIGLADKKLAMSCPWPPERWTDKRTAIKIRAGIKRVLFAKHIEKAAQNGNHDTIAFRKAKMPIRSYKWDTMLMHGVIAPAVPHDLGFIAHNELHADRWKTYFHVSGDDKGQAKWVKALEKPESRRELCVYNGKDASVLAFLVPELKKQLQDLHKGMELYDGYFERAAIAAEMRENGALANQPALREHRRKLGRRRADALREFRKTAATAGFRGPDPEGINPRSSQQTADLFFKCLRIAPTKWTDKGKASLDAKTLQNLVTHANVHVARCARSLLVYRRFHKLMSTYVLRMMPTHKKAYTDENWIIHADARVQGTKGGRWSYKQPNCFTGDTEVLTPAGWIRFDKYNGEQVAQFDPTTKQINFTEITGYIKKDNAKVIELSTRAINIAVTLDHDCLVYHRKGTAKVVHAKNYPQDHKQLHAANYVWPATDHVTPDLLALIIATQADGSITSKGEIDFSFHKERKATRLKTLLAKLGISYRDYSNTNRYRYLLTPQPCVDLTLKYLGPKKQFGSWLLNISKAAALRFDVEIWQWDGCATRRSMYASKDKINANWVATILTLLATRSRVRKYINQQGSISWQVDVVRKNYSWTTNNKKTQLENQTVYCVSVPSHAIVVQRKGRIVITNQCQNIPKPRFEMKRMADGTTKRILVAPGLRDIIRPRPGNYLCEADYSQLELRIIALLAGDPILLDLYARGIDVHQENAKQLFHTDAPTKQQRDLAKRFVYGVNYGGDAQTIWRSLVVDFPALSLDDVERLKERWYILHPKIVRWQKESVKLAYRLDYVECPLSGRRQYFHNRVEETKVYNFPVQGTGADIIDAAIVKVHRSLRRNKAGILLLQIHDALIVEGPDLVQLAKILDKHMTVPVTLAGKRVKLPIDWKVSNQDWGNCTGCDTIEEVREYQRTHKPAGKILLAT